MDQAQKIDAEDYLALMQEANYLRYGCMIALDVIPEDIVGPARTIIQHALDQSRDCSGIQQTRMRKVLGL